MKSLSCNWLSFPDFSIRLSTIRIWMHEKDIGKLTRVLWAGQGNRLRQQASTNPKVKRFLAAVPYVMNSIKDVHQSVVDNSLETLQATMESNVPPTLITCKDANGLNVIHKAAGLGHTMMLEYLLGIWPDGAHETDMTGKTALHWAASAKNNMRCYTLLTQAGCEEDALDYKMKTPLYYKQKHNEIERSFLTQVPEAPRVSQDIPVDWEALASEESDDKKKPEINIPNGRRRSDVLGNSVNLLTSRSEANSIENTSEPDLFQGDSVNEEHPEPHQDESESNDDLGHQDVENGHIANSEVDISESDPASPPKTPEETPNENDVEGEPGQELSQKLPEDENVGNALNDQNNNDENAVNQAELKESESNVKSEGEEENKFDEDNKDSGKEEIKNNDDGMEVPGTADIEVQEEKEEEMKTEVEEKEDNKNENENENKDNEDRNTEDNDDEKTEINDSTKDDVEKHNDDKDNKSEEQVKNGEEEVNVESESSEKAINDEHESSPALTEETQANENKSEDNQSEAIESEKQPVVEGLDSTSHSHPGTPLIEQKSPGSETQKNSIEKSSPVDIQTENSQPERPQSNKSVNGSSHSADSHHQEVEEDVDKVNVEENKESKNEESSEKDKEAHEEDDDEDDDDQVQFGSL